MSTITRYRFSVVVLTALLLATLTFSLTGGDRADAVDGPVEVVFVATGRNFPDALAGSTLATSTNAPMLTVEKDLPIPAATVDALTALDPAAIIVFGGPGAVSAEVFEALTTYARSGSVTRVAGDDRHETAAAIAEALPDKVADADLLDGLDASDFLRATAADDFLTAEDTGPITVPEVNYSAPRTHRVSVSARSFQPRVSGDDYQHYGEGIGGPETASTTMVAGVELPDGATITDVSFVFVDREIGKDVYAALIRHDLFEETTTVVAETRSTGQPGLVHVPQDDVTDRVVDNYTGTYYVSVLPITNAGDPILSTWAFNNLLFRAAVVRYTLDQAP